MLRLPWTIWRFTLLEMWRLLLLTAGVLVTVISFAVTVRLTAEGRLSPLDTLWYMVLAMPPMLQYALPFAAGFGATLAYHRMSQDNELTAAAASGISHRALLAPALATGLVLAGVIGQLNGWVIPRFLRSMEQLVVQDATRIVQNTLAAGRPLEVNNLQVIADSVRSLGPDDDRGITDELLLTNVFAMRQDAAGRVIQDVTAKKALVSFAPAPDNGENARSDLTVVTLHLIDAMISDRSEGAVKPETATVVWTIPGVFNDDPKYLTTSELRALPEHPERLNVISMRARDVAVHLAEQRMCDAINAALKSKGSVALADEAGRTWTIRGNRIVYSTKNSRWEILGGGKPIEIDVSGATRRVHFPKTAGLRTDIGRDRQSRHLKLALFMEDVSSRAEDGTPAGEATALENHGLEPRDENPLPALLQLSPAQLLKEAEADAQKNPNLRATVPADDLSKRLKRLGREIVSKQHERIADAVACLVMVLTGAVTAMRLGTRLPLTVYLWSFFPALFGVITIAAGQQMAHQIGAIGLVVLWSGVSLLGLYTLSAFRIVRRH